MRILGVAKNIREKKWLLMTRFTSTIVRRSHVDEGAKGRGKTAIQQILKSGKKLILIEGAPGVGKSTLSFLGTVQKVGGN